MSILVKSAGVYSEVQDVFVKQNGVYGAASVFAKVAGAYVSVGSEYPAIATLPNLVAFWDFSEESGQPRTSKVGRGAFPLTDALGSGVGRASEGPFSGFSAQFDGVNDYLRLAGTEVGDLNASVFGDEVTVLAMVKRSNTTSGFIGGMWQENDLDPRRQYGLFIDLGAYGGEEQVCGHISKTGGPSEKILTPGEFLPFSRDYSASLTPVENNEWVCVAFTYNGSEIRSFYESRFEARPTYTEPGPVLGEGLTYAKNPYAFTQGLNDTSSVSDFTVGAVRLTAGPGNWYGGLIAGLAVCRKALTQAEVFRFQRAASSASVPALTYRFSGVATSGQNAQLSFFAMKTYRGTNGEDVSTQFVDTGGWRQTNQGGQRYLTRSTTSAGPCLFADEQSFGVPYAHLQKLSLVTNNANTADVLHFCIRISGQWYASNQTFNQTVAAISASDWTNAETKELTVNNSTQWRTLTLNPGVELSLGAVTGTDLTNQIIECFGVFSPSQPAGNLRVRNLSIFAPIP